MLTNNHLDMHFKPMLVFVKNGIAAYRPRAHIAPNFELLINEVKIW